MISALILIIILGVILYFIWKPKDSEQRQRQELDMSAYSNQEQEIIKIMPGAVIKINHVGPDMQDLDLKVLAKHKYYQGNYEWYELECDAGDKKVWLTIEQDDELELALSLEKLKLSDLGITKFDLRRIDNEEEGSVIYNNQRYNYDDSDDAVYVRNCDESRAEEFYYWEFEDEEEEYFISVEDWDGSIEVSWGQYISPSKITIYSLDS